MSDTWVCEGRVCAGASRFQRIAIALAPCCAAFFLAGCGEGASSPLPATTTPMTPSFSDPCVDGPCLVVPQAGEYCSLEPTDLTGADVLATKARLRLPPGRYAAGDVHAFADFEIELRTPRSSHRLRPRSPLRAEPVAGRQATDLEPGRAARFELEAPFEGTDLRLETVFLRVPQGADGHYALDAAHDMQAFFERGFNLYVRQGEHFVGLPGLGSRTLLFAPCRTDGLADERFTFQFADGSALGLTVRAVQGSTGVGFYAGRLVAARGVWRGQQVAVDDPERLAFFGSTRSWAEMAIPSLAVRIGDEGSDCGVILDRGEWSSPVAVQGYTAYRMTCDGRRGERVELRAVSYPERYALP